MPDVPPPFRLNDGMSLELREGGGCTSLFGLPFFLAGIFLALAGIGVVPIDNESDLPGWGRAVVPLMAVVFTAVGAGLVFGRRWIVLDPGHGCVSRSVGLLVPMRREESLLSGYDSVTIASESADSSDTYPVRLNAITGAAFPLTSPAAYQEARLQAEFVSRFLRLPLLDATTDSRLPLSPEQAGQSLRDRLRVESPPAGPSAPPSHMRSEVSSSRLSATILIPGRYSLVPALLLPLIPALALLLVPFTVVYHLVPPLLQAFRTTHASGTVEFASLAFLVLAFAAVPLIGVITMVRAALRGQTLVSASREEIRIDRRGAWRTRTTVIPAQEILAIDCSTAGGSQTPPSFEKWIPNKGLVIKARSGLFIIGEGLSREELSYLNSVLLRVLNSQS
jgi:hypothetical protein